jgi:hypothetical protein
MASAGARSKTILLAEAEREDNAHLMFRLFLTRHEGQRYCFLFAVIHSRESARGADSRTPHLFAGT